MSPSFKRGLACRTKVTHPVDFSECSYRKSLLVVFHHRYWRGARYATFTTAHGEQGHIARFQTDAQQSRREEVSKTDERRNLIRFCHEIDLSLLCNQPGNAMLFLIVRFVCTTNQI